MTRFYERKRGPDGPCLETDLPGVLVSRLPLLDEGRAVVATGSSFPDGLRGGHGTVVGQGNNAFVFPGLGLGVMPSGARRMSDDMLSAAAEALADDVDAGRLEHGAPFPSVAKLSSVSRQVAVAVVRRAQREGLATERLGDDLDRAVSEAMWTAAYPPLRRPS